MRDSSAFGPISTGVDVSTSSSTVGSGTDPATEGAVSSYRSAVMNNLIRSSNEDSVPYLGFNGRDSLKLGFFSFSRLFRHMPSIFINL